MTEQEKQLWAQVINDSRWYDGTPQGMVKLSEHLNELFISERDKFAIGFAMWIGTDECPYEIEGAKTDAETVKGYLDLFKQSLNR